MIDIRGAAELLSAMQQVRHGARAFTTNFFAPPDQVQAWLDRHSLSYLPGERALLVFRKDRDFHHLYHCAADTNALSGVLLELDRQSFRTTLTADLVGRPEEVEAGAPIYATAGFGYYAALFRMTRVGGAAADDHGRDSDVVFAEPADASAVLLFLERLLDRFAEQIPELDEIRAGIGRRNIVLVRRGEEVGGLVFFETVGFTTVLRYWWVDPAWRGQGVGSRLIRAFFRQCKGAKRIVLWVLANNEDAIAKYRYYGFARERLIDQVLIRKGIAAR